MVHMISYDLNKPGQNYDNVHEAIEGLGVWCHYLESTYLVNTSLSLDDVQSKVTSCLDASDRMIICEINKPINGWLSEEQWNWINSNL